MQNISVQGAVIKAFVVNDYVAYETDYSPDESIHDAVAKAAEFDNWTLQGIGAVPGWDMNSAGSASWVIERTKVSD